MPVEHPGFQTLYNNPLLADMTLTLHDEKIHAHKVILMGASQQFLQLFDNKNPIKASQSEYEISNHALDVARAMIKWIYGYPWFENEDVNIPIEQRLDFGVKVFVIADEYGVQSLGQAVTSWFVKNLQNADMEQEVGKVVYVKAFEKVLEMYAVAKPGDRRLSDAIVEFCVRSNLQNVESKCGIVKVLEAKEPFAGRMVRLLLQKMAESSHRRR